LENLPAFADVFSSDFENQHSVKQQNYTAFISYPGKFARC